MSGLVTMARLHNVVTPKLHLTPPIAPHQMDVLMCFGFIACVFTSVVLIYRRQLEQRRPALSFCLAVSATYGFLHGDTVLGFILAAVSIAEFNRWRYRQQLGGHSQIALMKKRRKTAALFRTESRIDRMFGPAEV